MTFSFSNAAQAGQVEEGSELKEIQSDQVGFQSLNGDAKLKLLPSSWPSESLPLPSASLLSVASSKGLIAAAGPDCVVVTGTESVRNAIRKAADQGDNIRIIEPEIKIPIARPSHVAFSGDESVLVVSSEDSGGLAAFHVDGLKNGQTNPALQLSMNNTSLRALVPNPEISSAELFAAVTVNGELLLADLKSGELRNGSAGLILKTGVSCLSWSNRGKQLVAGLADGTASQIKPDGTSVATIPRPPSLEGAKHISAISWLENDVFFVIYSPNDNTSDGMMNPSDFFIITRDKSSKNFLFRRLPEVVPAFGLPRLPAFQFVGRLRGFMPHLQDLLIVAATNSSDIGLVTKADAPLSLTDPVLGEFTLTSVDNDSKRASLPLSEQSADTSPIGLAIDLSSRDILLNPIPSEPEIRESATPVPNLLVLNNEGFLASWWIIYTDSIREKIPYEGLVAAGGMPAPEVPESSPYEVISSAPLASPAPTAFGRPGFGQPNFGAPTTFGKPAMNAFGSPTQSAFGSGSSGSFGATSGKAGTLLGGERPSWTTTGFGETSLGSAPPGGNAAPTFGSAANLGNRAPAFGQSGFPLTKVANNRPTFGQSGFGTRADNPFGGGSSASPFASNASEGNKPLGFASFSNAGGFSGIGSKATAESLFAKTTSDSPFSETSNTFASEKKTTDSFGFSNAKTESTATPFGATGAFKLESTFNGDDTSKDDQKKPGAGGAFSFDGDLRDLLNESEPALSPSRDRETDMSEEYSSGQQDHGDGIESLTSQHPLEGKPALTTPPSTLSHSKATPAPPLSNLFGTSQRVVTPAALEKSTPMSTIEKTTLAPVPSTMFGAAARSDTTPASVQDGQPTWTFGLSTTPKESPLPKSIPLEDAANGPAQTPKIQAEPPSDDETRHPSNISEPPLPPEPTSKTSYTAGDSSVSSLNSKSPEDDAPLPPDFLPVNKSVDEPEQAELPADEDFSSDFEGTAEDASQEISPIEHPSAELTEQIQTSPESSFGRPGDKSPEASPTGGIFTKVTPREPPEKTPRPLFGEVGTGPVFPPPRPQESPRSPSPVRNPLIHDLLRPESVRSVSAPSRPSAIEIRRAHLAKSAFLQRQGDSDERRKEEERFAAAAAAKRKTEAEEVEKLEDDEDERIRAELARPLEPSTVLDPFVFHEQDSFTDESKTGIPGQIERLYRDINSMIDTLGINSRSLSAFIAYQMSQEPNNDWPDVLESETPSDTLNDEWVLDDITRLYEGVNVLNRLLEVRKIDNAAAKLQQCQNLQSLDIMPLKSKIISLRKTITTKTEAEAADPPLLPEQLSAQHALRKLSTAVQTCVVEAEQNLAILRAKLAEVGADSVNGSTKGSLSGMSSKKKPTVEAVTNTIAKMTAMAETKSSDLDYLEAQLRKMGLVDGSSVNASWQGSVGPNGTPKQMKAYSASARTPGSSAGSVYHTPDSKRGASARSAHSARTEKLKSSTSLAEAGGLVSAEDRERWREKRRRKREADAILRRVIAESRVAREKATKAAGGYHKLLA